MNYVIVIFLAAAVRAGIGVAWSLFKKRQAQKPTPMALRKGVYVPWGPVEKMQAVFKGLLYLGVTFYALFALAGAYVFITGKGF